jgi:3-oxoacyl-[acyl-carrier protein] reductase
MTNSAVERALSTFGRIDALTNIAGAVPQIDLFEMTDEQWDDGLVSPGARWMTGSTLRMDGGEVKSI